MKKDGQLLIEQQKEEWLLRVWEEKSKLDL